MTRSPFGMQSTYIRSISRKPRHGNPQNILIGSLSHISYGRFAAALIPVAVFALAVNIAVIWLVFRRELSRPFPRTEGGKPPVVLDFLKVGMPSAILGATFGALWLGS
jgi:Na+/H+ antiporter NhaD/arsenite permease-like protein